jgi:hypothetical protein
MSRRGARAVRSSGLDRYCARSDPSGVLYVTWDEGSSQDRRGVDGQGGGRVALAAGGAARRHTRVATRANHYALLRTLEARFGARAVAHAGADSTPLLPGLLRP